MMRMAGSSRWMWDGIIRKPHASELGWKDTVRISPLEDTIVALRPIIPSIPWDLPNSIRLLDPSMPEGAFLADTTAQEALGLPIFAFDPNGEPIDVINHYINFGWEYVWHCHILSHEEMDMMRPQVVGIAPKDPTDLVATRIGNGNNRRVDLQWEDNSLNETEFTVQRATSSGGPWSTIATLSSDDTGPVTGLFTYTDPIGNTNTTYYYRVQAVNVVGDTWDYSDPELNEGAGFPTLSLASAFSNTATFGTVALPPATPSNLTGTTFRQGNSARVSLNWVDNANNETGFTVQYATNDTFSVGVTNSNINQANATTWTSGNLPRNTGYYFRVRANNATGSSDWSNTFFIVTAP